MKKLILSALMLTALSVPSFTHSIPYKPLFDIVMIAGNTRSFLKNYPEYSPDCEPCKPSFLLAHFGIYAYAFHSLWKSYKNYKENAGKIQVKMTH